MGRPERPIETSAGELGRFAADLRQLREDAGRPTYATMARGSGVSRSALAAAAAGQRLPRWRTVEQYVRYCGGDLDDWRRRWDAVQQAPSSVPTGSSELEVPAELGGTAPRRRWLLVATAAAVVVALAGAAVLLWPINDGLPSATDQPIFSEDFDGDQLNLQKWIAPSDPAHLYPRNNVLNMLGTTEAGQGVNVDLTAQDVGPFREIDFVIGVLDYPKPGSGGGSLVLTEQSGRTQKLVFGASPGPVPLSVAVLRCSRPACERYDDYEPPAPPTLEQQFVSGEPVPIKIVQAGATLTYYMRDVVIGQAEVSEPLTAFTFNSYAEPDEQWQITVDAVRVYR